MNVLLVFEQLPETVQYVSISDPSDVLLKILEACNGLAINSDDTTPEMTILVDALATKKEYCENAKHPLALTLQSKFDVPPKGVFDRVFSFGFCM